MWGVKRTTIYLPESLKKALESTATERGQTEAEVIRTALRAELERTPPRPRLPLIAQGLGDQEAAGRVEELLQNFGRR
jgi:predicted transcriptional regulator